MTGGRVTPFEWFIAGLSTRRAAADVNEDKPCLVASAGSCGPHYVVAHAQWRNCYRLSPASRRSIDHRRLVRRAGAWKNSSMRKSNSTRVISSTFAANDS